MLRRAKELTGYKLGARDGEIGKVKEFYFDDQSWTVRYLIADTGGWLTGRQVLISPYALEPANEGRRSHSGGPDQKPDRGKPIPRCRQTGLAAV